MVEESCQEMLDQLEWYGEALKVQRERCVQGVLQVERQLEALMTRFHFQTLPVASILDLGWVSTGYFET